MHSLSHPTLVSHLRALWTIAWRDWKHFWRYPVNTVLTVVQPLIWLAPVYFMGQVFSVNGQALGFAGYSGSADYMSFIIVGTALNNFVNAVFWGMGYALKNDMDGGVLEANWLMPTPRLLLLVGHTLSSLATTAITSTVMMLVAALLFGFRPSGNLWAALLTVVPLLVGLYGFGFAFAALVMILREANALVDMSSFLIQLFSGSSFPVTALPGWLLPVALILPLTYGYDAFRGYLLETRTLLPLHLEALVLIGFMLVMPALGLLAFRALERRVRQMGTLGQH
jgi:ABC-2 type transport system permease protein